MSEEIRTEFRVHCGGCGHEWVAAWLPMGLDTFAKVLKRAACPSCGADAKRIFAGPAKKDPA